MSYRDEGPSQKLSDYPTVRDLFPSDYLEAEDFKGKVVKVRIDKINPRFKIRDGEFKAVANLTGVATGSPVPKPWIISRSNGRVLGRVLGDDVASWLGKEVELGGNRERHFGKTMLVIRVFVNGKAQVPK